MPYNNLYRSLESQDTDLTQILNGTKAVKANTAVRIIDGVN